MARFQTQLFHLLATWFGAISLSSTCVSFVTCSTVQSNSCPASLAYPVVSFSYCLIIFFPGEIVCSLSLRPWYIFHILPFQPDPPPHPSGLGLPLMLNTDIWIRVLSEAFLPKRWSAILGPICSDFTGIQHIFRESQVSARHICDEDESEQTVDGPVEKIRCEYKQQT